MAGILVCVVGPSGAGKDTLIAGARKALEDDDHFVFPRRIVTRQPSEADDHDTLPPERFATLREQGRFALSWDAHGLSYAIPGLVLDDLAGRRIATDCGPAGSSAARISRRMRGAWAELSGRSFPAPSTAPRRPS